MADYKAPGVYVEEISGGTRPIEGVETAVPAFIGFAKSVNAKSANTPISITSWNQYIKHFGHAEKAGIADPHVEGAYLSHAVEAYFNNGGGRCYVINMRHTESLQDSAPAPPFLDVLGTHDKKSFKVISLVPDQEITIEVSDSSSPDKSGSFNISISVPGHEPEEYKSVVVKTKGTDSIGSIDSKLVQIEVEPGLTNPVLNRIPKLKTLSIPAADVTNEWLKAASPKAEIEHKPWNISSIEENDAAQITHIEIQGDEASRKGIKGLAGLDDVTMVCCPDLMSLFQHHIQTDQDKAITLVNAVQQEMIAHCELMQDRVAILDPIPNLSPQHVKQWKRSAGLESKYAALYYPWLEIPNPNSQTDSDNPVLSVPPSGHVAGIYARTDTSRGVHKAPANEQVRGIVGLQFQVNHREQGMLNPEGINCIRLFPTQGFRVWGARTLSSDAAWRYVNVRRLFNFVEKSIERGTQWVVFEPNNRDLWARVKRDVSAFLTSLWRDGMLFGRSPSEAFYVKCDEDLNPRESRDLGRLIVEVGLAPIKPAEFVIFRISQMSGDDQ